MGPTDGDLMKAWRQRREERWTATPREHYEALMAEADLAFERGDLDGAQALVGAAWKHASRIPLEEETLARAAARAQDRVSESTNLRCADCGRRFYSEAFQQMLERGERCPDCQGGLERSSDWKPTERHLRSA